MRTFGRFVTATFLSPLAVCPAVAPSLVFVWVLGSADSVSLQSYVDSVVVFSFYGSILGLAVLLVVGLPVYLLLAWAGFGHSLPCSVAGGAIGMLLGFGTTGFPGEWFGLITMACGAAVAATFSRIFHGTWGNPKGVAR